MVNGKLHFEIKLMYQLNSAVKSTSKKKHNATNIRNTITMYFSINYICFMHACMHENTVNNNQI